MAQKQKPKDPFTGFSAADGLCDSDFSTDESESEEETQEKRNSTNGPNFISKSAEKICSDALPPPNFEKIQKSSFLDDKNQKVVDWDKIAKNNTNEEMVDITNTNAMPPPKSYEPQTDKLKPTIGDNSGPANLKRTCSDPGTVYKFRIFVEKLGKLVLLKTTIHQ